MNSIRKFVQGFMSAALEHFLKLFEQKLVAGELGELLLFFDDGAVFIADASQCIKVARMHCLAEDACIEKSSYIDRGDLFSQAFDQSQKPLKAFIGKHVVYEKAIELSPDPIYTSGALDHARGIPMQVIVDEMTAVLK